jgi:hypothetical protein
MFIFPSVILTVEVGRISTWKYDGFDVDHQSTPPDRERALLRLELVDAALERANARFEGGMLA